MAMTSEMQNRPLVVTTDITVVRSEKKDLDRNILHQTVKASFRKALQKQSDNSQLDCVQLWFVSKALETCQGHDGPVEEVGEGQEMAEDGSLLRTGGCNVFRWGGLPILYGTGFGEDERVTLRVGEDRNISDRLV